jgi:hypothetical protein
MLGKVPSGYTQKKKTEHQNPEFGHTQGEIQKNPAKKKGVETQKTINFGGKLSFILSFLSLERVHCCYVYFHSLLVPVQQLLYRK